MRLFRKLLAAILVSRRRLCAAGRPAASTTMHAGNEHAGMRGAGFDDDASANFFAGNRGPYGLGHGRGAHFNSRTHAHDQERQLDADVSRERICSR